jgi:hypothetical protein
MDFPATKNAPFVRTDFADDRAWNEIVAAVRAESPEGFLANVDTVTDPAFDEAQPTDLAASAARLNSHSVLFVADTLTMQHAEHPIICLDLHTLGNQFRVVPAELQGVENNLSIANMDFEEFASSVNADGIFRGF